MKNEGRTSYPIKNAMSTIRTKTPEVASASLYFRCSVPMGTERKEAWMELKSCSVENRSNAIAAAVTDALAERLANNALTVEPQATTINARVTNRRVRDPVSKYPFAER